MLHSLSIIKCQLKHNKCSKIIIGKIDLYKNNISWAWKKIELKSMPPSAIDRIGFSVCIHIIKYNHYTTLALAEHFSYCYPLALPPPFTIYHVLHRPAWSAASHSLRLGTKITNHHHHHPPFPFLFSLIACRTHIYHSQSHIVQPHPNKRPAYWFKKFPLPSNMTIISSNRKYAVVFCGSKHFDNKTRDVDGRVNVFHFISLIYVLYSVRLDVCRVVSERVWWKSQEPRARKTEPGSCPSHSSYLRLPGWQEQSYTQKI